MHPTPKPLKSPQPQGFALLVSIALMAFILLLLLSVTTLVQVESQTAGIAQQQMEARQVALYGLNEALGELQALAGPDQRITTTAGILASTTSSRMNNLTGVWVSDPDGVTIDGRPYAYGDLINWLVSDAQISGASASPFDQAFNENTMPAKDENHIPMVWAGSLTDNDNNGEPDNLNDAVVVDISQSTLSENGVTTGRYGWWIGDEGVKARVNLSRAESADERTKQRSILEANSTSISNPTVLTGLESIDFETQAERILDIDSLDIMDGSSGETGGNYFHHLTTHSAGVLADVKNGGLKKDLSLAFEMDDTDFNASEFGAGLPAEQTIEAPGFVGRRVKPVFQFTSSNYTNSTGETFTGSANGPSWHLLRDYYRLYHVMENPMGNPTLDARVFGPNSNHGDSNLQTPNTISGSPVRIDQQPAILLAGGKSKFQTQGIYNNSPFMDKDNFRNNKDSHPNPSASALDFAMLNSDPIKMGEEGDPLRGGGQSSNGTTMPVMTTANYMPYMMRYVGEIGIWLEPVAGPLLDSNNNPAITNPIAVKQANRERFILHNPFNVTLRHNEIAIDSFGCETGIGVTDASGNEIELFVTTNEGNNRFNRLPLQHESERQSRIPEGNFAPGQIKTFTANSYGNNESQSVSYADEGLDPRWHHFKFRSNNTGGTVGYIEEPLSNADFVSLHIFGNGSNSNGNRESNWEGNFDYTVGTFLFTTHLKQNGNDDFGGLAIKDSWPMASVIDTGLWMPGPDVELLNQSYSNDQPGFEERFFPTGSNTLVIDDQTVANFRNITGSANRQQASMPMAIFDLQLRPAQYTAGFGRYPAFSRSNPLAPVKDNKNLLPADDFVTNSVGFPKISPDMDIKLDSEGVGAIGAELNFWGPNNGRIISPGTAVSNPVLIELPTAPMLSLGKLQHANISVHSHMPAHAIGNSLASVYIPSEDVFTVYQNRYDQDRVFYDLSYLMNEALWDSYFFSSYSIPYEEDNYDWLGRNVQESFEEAFDLAGIGSLPNARMNLTLADGEDNVVVKSKLFQSNGKARPETTPGITADAGYHRAAENLIADGSFNVNSTSVEAWRAVLSGARDMPIYRSGELSPTVPTAEHTPLARFSQPTGEEWDGLTTSNEAWSGFRSLSDSDITDLATAIVEELKERRGTTHPYLSLADFVNRELVNQNDDNGRTGLLQAAIDKSGLNSTYLSSGNSEIQTNDLSDQNKGEFPEPTNILDDINSATAFASAPTYIMQADILQAIGSFISVRSDTFRIRSYGESKNPITGEATGRVWLEAIVQRIPEPVSPLDGSTISDSSYWTALDASGNPSPNGRKFKIVSIRELSEEDV